MMLFGSNPFPYKRVPEIYLRLDMVYFYRGGIHYEQLDDGEFFDAAYTYMQAKQAQLNEIKRRERAAQRVQ